MAKEDPKVDAELVSLLDEEDDFPDERAPFTEEEMVPPESSGGEPQMRFVDGKEDPEDEKDQKDTVSSGDPKMVLVEEEEEFRPISELQKETESENEDKIGIQRILSKFGDSVDIIINNQRDDRDQIERAIAYIEGQIKGKTEKKEKVPSMYIDAWTRLLQSKADVNSNASKVLDSIAKLLSAGKGNDLVLQLGVVNSGDLDLEQLLNQPRYEDEIGGTDSVL